MTKRFTMLLGLVGLVAVMACAKRTVVVTGGGHGREGWEKLGDREVNGRVDYDTVAVGAREGRFRKLMIVVENSAVEMFDVNVTFGDGETWSPATRLVFAADTRSHVIDLPGNERVIRSVAFKYGNIPGGGNAHVELWAR